MSSSPPTRPTLLVRLRNPRDAVAWGCFVETYAPVVFGYARRRGLQDADAADLTQDVLRSVAAAIDRFDYAPARGGFRAWLFQIARNHLRSFFRRVGRADRLPLAPPERGAVSLEDVADPNSASDEEWETEWQRGVFARACEEVRRAVEPNTWEAFYRTAVLGGSGASVADELGVTVAAVYLARSRVLARLQKFVNELEE